MNLKQTDKIWPFVTSHMWFSKNRCGPGLGVRYLNKSSAPDS